MFAVFALDAPAIVFRADPHARALAVRAGYLDMARSCLADSPIIETAGLVAIFLGGPLGLRAGGKIPVNGREPGAKNLVAIVALHAPIQILRADPHVRALAARAGDQDVTRHGLLESPIMERVNLVGIRVSRFGRRQFGASQETFFSGIGSG
jgi:hypothetical protein